MTVKDSLSASELKREQTKSADLKPLYIIGPIIGAENYPWLQNLKLFPNAINLLVIGKVDKCFHSDMIVGFERRIT